MSSYWTFHRHTIRYLINAAYINQISTQCEKTAFIGCHLQGILQGTVLGPLLSLHSSMAFRSLYHQTRDSEQMMPSYSYTPGAKRMEDDFNKASKRCKTGKINEPPRDKTSNVRVRPAKTQISLGIRPV